MSTIKNLTEKIITAVDAKDSALQANIDKKADTTALDAAVENLDTRIKNILENTDETALNSLTEIVTAFKNADNDLQGAIGDLAKEASDARNAASAARVAEIDEAIAFVEGL